MTKEYQLRLQVFSNGRFVPTRGTPWEGIEKTAAFSTQVPKLLKGEKVIHHRREFRAV